MKRNETRKIQIGQISIGGSDHVIIQSMCSIKTSKVDEVSAQINRCAALGAELMRCSVLDFEDAEAFREIKKRVSIPLYTQDYYVQKYKNLMEQPNLSQKSLLQ